MNNNHIQPEKKRLFILFLSVASFALITIILLFWYFSLKGIGSLSSLAGAVFSIIILGFGLFLLFATIVLIVTMISGRQTKLAGKLRGTVTKLLFPIVLRVAKTLKIDKDKIIRSFISINNELVMESVSGKDIHNLLILLPHCIQLENCELKITKNIEICKQCGRCDIQGLARISENYRLTVSVATGGTIARRIVKDTRPDLILAVACERDMLSGIQDTYPLPVIGVLNERPYGPCINTKVSIDAIEEIIKRLNIKQKEETKG